jgi:hypothetical protein
MMDANGSVNDFVLGLPELHGQHSGVNIASVVATTLTNFGVDKDLVGYFVLDDAFNNDTAVASLADLYSFETAERRLRCCCHILNLSAQVVIWGRDREAYENSGGNLKASQANPAHKHCINSPINLLLLPLLLLSSSPLLMPSFKDDHGGEPLRCHAMPGGRRWWGGRRGRGEGEAGHVLRLG